MHHAAVVGDDEAASPQQRRERLRSGRRRRQLRAWADLRGDAGRELLLVWIEAAQHEWGQAAHLEQSLADGRETRRRPAAGTTEGARAGHQQHHLIAQAQRVPALGCPGVIVRRNAQLEPRFGRAPRSEHTDDIQPVVHLVLPAEAAVEGRLRQEPGAAAVVQADASRGAAAEAECGVLGDPERRGQMVQKHQRVPAIGAQVAGQTERPGQAVHGVGWPVEREFVEDHDFVERIQSAQGWRAGGRCQHADVRTREAGPQRAQGRGDREQIAEAGEFDHEHSSRRAHGRILRM